MMKYALSENDKKNIYSLKRIGLNEIWIYKSHNYVTVVAFALIDGSHVTIDPKEQHVVNWFEVLLITAGNKRPIEGPFVKITSRQFEDINNIFLVSLCNWEMPTIDADKNGLLGDTTNSTTIFEGREADAPKNALNYSTFDAGIKIQFSNGASFFVVTANPFELAISHELSFSQIDESSYELTYLC